MHVLLIENDKTKTEKLKRKLKFNFLVDVIESGYDGIFLAQNIDYDFILVGISLPDIDVISFSQQLRTLRINTPIFIIANKKDKNLRISALEAGADDFLATPADLKELLPRMRTVLRRSTKTLDDPILLTVDDLTINVTTMKATRGEKNLFLRRKEFLMLEYLMRNKGRVITRNMFLDYVWENEIETFSSVVDVHINYLREVIDKPFTKKLIKTVYGWGYMIDD